jgi:drug/metabolite transporter (DMT)-like permease
MVPTRAHAPHYPLSGWVEAGLFVFVIGLLSVAYAVGHQIGAHPIAFVLYAMVVCAALLLGVTGLGPDALAIILAPQSWFIGIGTISMEVFYCLMLQQVPPADGSLLVRLTVPVSLLVGWGLFARRPQPLTMLGTALMCLGMVPALIPVDAARLPAVLVASIGCALAFNLRTFSAEFHPWNRQARTVTEKVRITGLVVLVTAIASLALAGTATTLVAAGTLPPTSLVPTPAQMLHVPTILLGAVVGSVILTAMWVLGFSSVVKITSENFAAVAGFSPLAALIVQLAASAAGLIPHFPVDGKLLAGMAAVVAGVFLMLFAVRRG